MTGAQRQRWLHLALAANWVSREVGRRLGAHCCAFNSVFYLSFRGCFSLEGDMGGQAIILSALSQLYSPCFAAVATDRGA